METSSSSRKFAVGRGADFNPTNRFEGLEIVLDPVDPDEETPRLKTRFFRDLSESIITVSQSPDMEMTTINPTAGANMAAPTATHVLSTNNLGFSAGLDFESKIMVKTDAPNLLRRELAKPRWKPVALSMSGVTDCYQPAEKHFQITRQCLEVLAEFRNPVGIITKNHLVTRDIDILSDMARDNCAKVFISVTTLDPALGRVLEPRASLPAYRLDTVRKLTEAGIPVGVMLAPIIPGLTDSEIPAILKSAAEAGACDAGFVMLRLPHGVKEIFISWLETHYPDKANKILGLVQDMRGGKLYDASWGTRFSGTGHYADQIAQLFRVGKIRAGMKGSPELSTENFRKPAGNQMELF